ncbi:MAG: purine/pyrimidine permease [Deltaproteobacteria bacterium]|jgi:xanthine permease XanP/xanthine permease XanQ|nr:purine/pyrimidine permease [Deltaproteobacteria bacterium]
MSETKQASSRNNFGIIYGLEDKPPFFLALLTAVQHLMSMVVSIGTPPLIICRALDMPLDITIYLVNTAFFVSGIGTFFQTSRFGPVGSGLLSIQATNFLFTTAFISMGAAAVKADPTLGPEALVAMMTGATVVGAFIQIVLSRLTNVLKRVFTPLVCGITVTLVGISLLNVAMINVVGGYASFGTENFASVKNLSLGATVLLVIIVCNCAKSPAIRMSAMIFGFLAGVVLAFSLGMLNPRPENAPYFSLPAPFRYGFSFSFGGFISVALLYVVTTVEATGDLSATSMLSRLPTAGPEFVKRIKGGILCDGLASFLSGCFNSLPMAIFAQNNGVIQLTGNASRHVGKFIACLLVVMGVFPVVGVVFNIIPDPVLGGALILLFGIITTTGMRIIFTDQVSRRSIVIVSISLGSGIGAAFQPDFTMHLPRLLADFLHSPVACGGSVAILANLVMPMSMEGDEGDPGEPGPRGGETAASDVGDGDAPEAAASKGDSAKACAGEGGAPGADGRRTDARRADIRIVGAPEADARPARNGYSPEECSMEPAAPEEEAEEAV